MSEIYEDGVFFHNATRILAECNSKKAMMHFYDFLSQTFPIEGMVLHHFQPSSQTLLELYFIQRNTIRFIGRFVPFSREQTMFLRAFSMVGGIHSIRNSGESKTSSHVDNDIEEFVQKKQRAHLVCCLNAGNASLGLLRLLGKDVNCFSEAHNRRLMMLAIPLSFALFKLLREEEVQHFFLKNVHVYQAENTEYIEQQEELIGTSGGLASMMETIRKLSGTDAPVLILGETGTGKELVANAIQKESQRNGKPFIKVNCGAIPETLMDSTLFGYEKGAFTGAYASTAGKFELAHGGTLFLDELGELSLQAQVRLLRTLQNHEIERVGSTNSIPVDVRIIAATNRDIQKMLREGAFREDLYHRLSVFTIAVPPLRDRPQDLLPLAEHFINKATRRLKLPPVSGIDPISAEKLLQHTWPGNVRELENLVERAVILDYNNKLCLDRYILPHLTSENAACRENELDARIRHVVQEEFDLRNRLGAQMGAVVQQSEQPEEILPLEKMIRAHIMKALAQARGKIHGPGGAGEILGINPDTLRKKMKKFEIASSSWQRSS